MKITLLTVGKLKEKYWQEAVKEYRKRLGAYCELREIELKEHPRDDIEEEGISILNKINNTDYVITLEIEGVPLSSEEFAKKMADLGVEGKSKLVFVIGGSCGLSPTVKKRSDFALSFSKMTFTHQMMKAILMEQIYRGFKINKGEKYHK